MEASPSVRRADAVACLACGGTATRHWADAHDVEYHSSDDVFAYHLCGDCQALSIDPVPEARLGEIYPANYYAYAAPRHSLAQRVKRRLDRRYFRRLLARVPGAQLSVLDVGGGAGWELVTARESDARVALTTVVDLDPEAMPLAHANGHSYACSRIEDFRTDARFDVVLLLNLIEHVRDPAAVLAQVGELLAPGGILVIKTPNHDALDARVFRHRSWAGLHCPRHWVVFTRGSFERLVTRCGLRVRSASYTQGAPFWAASVLAWFAGRGLIDISPQRPAVAHPLFSPLAAAFAAFDYLRLPLSRTSQMFFVLDRVPDPPG